MVRQRRSQWMIHADAKTGKDKSLLPLHPLQEAGRSPTSLHLKCVKKVVMFTPALLALLLIIASGLQHLLWYVSRRTKPLPPVKIKAAFRSRPQNRHTLVVDVVSIGSNSRAAYHHAQNQTWIHQKYELASIRHFFALTEDHHVLANDTCDTSFILHNVAKCAEQSNINAVQRGNLIYSNINSTGWHCAQKRLTVGLGRIVADQYFDHDNRKKQQLPDWLLLVDDDTLFHMSVFQIAVSQLNYNSSYVLAGRHITFDYPYGGWGTALSKGAIERLYQPMHCNFSAASGIASSSNYQKHACATLKKNMANERDFFVNGDTLASLMLKIATGQNKNFDHQSTGAKKSTVRTPFCYHSDWLNGYFFQHYLLMGWTIPLFPSCPSPLKCSIPAKIKEDETSKDAECTKDYNVMACHYQTPEMMQAISNATQPTSQLDANV